jgi:hypothetical protein
MRSYYPKVYSCLEWQLYTHPINPISPSWIAAIASNKPVTYTPYVTHHYQLPRRYSMHGYLPAAPATTATTGPRPHGGLVRWGSGANSQAAVPDRAGGGNGVNLTSAGSSA